MSFDLDNHTSDPALPSDITLRTPIYRRRGVIASLVMTMVARWSARRQLARITRQYRRPAATFDIPPYLREDIGLPPLPLRPLRWWERWP